MWFFSLTYVEKKKGALALIVCLLENAPSKVVQKLKSSTLIGPKVFSWLRYKIHVYVIYAIVNGATKISLCVLLLL